MKSLVIPSGQQNREKRHRWVAFSSERVSELRNACVYTWRYEVDPLITFLSNKSAVLKDLVSDVCDSVFDRF